MYRLESTLHMLIIIIFMVFIELYSCELGAWRNLIGYILVGSLIIKTLAQPLQDSVKPGLLSISVDSLYQTCLFSYIVIQITMSPCRFRTQKKLANRLN